jgi:hypothetical protein
MKLRAAIPLLSAVALLAVGACEDDPSGPVLERSFTVSMTGPKEVPPVTTAATGTATFTLDAAETTLSYSISVQNMSSNITAAHIHLGRSGVAFAGNIIIALTTPVNNSTVTGTITSSATLGLGLTWNSLIDLIRNGDTYVNVHTMINGAGEIRGQIDSTP